MPKLYISPSSQQANTYANGTNEEIQMNKVADVLCPELTRHGIEWMRNNPANDYNGHIKESDIYKPDYHIAIHSNASGTPGSTVRGCVVFCYKPDFNNPSLGTQMAVKIFNYMSAITPTADRGVRDGSQTLSEIAYTDAPAVLIEVDFHDNLDGANWIVSHINEIAHAILLGILQQLGMEYKPTDDQYEAIITGLRAEVSALKMENAQLKKLYDAEVAKNKVLQAQYDELQAKYLAETAALQKANEILAGKLSAEMGRVTKLKEWIAAWDVELDKISGQMSEALNI